MGDRLIQPDMQTFFSLKDRIPIDQSTTYVNSLIGNMQDNILTKVYFSPENVKIVQNGIRAGVYSLSNKEHIIHEQDENELIIIMRSVYLQHGLNEDNNIKKQVEALNQLVLKYAIPQIYSELEGYIKYQRDSGSLAVPMAHPKATYTGNQLEYNNML